MRIFDIIVKKKRGMTLDAAEITYVVESYTAGRIADGPLAALLMAICFNGLNRAETAALTMAMAHSGEIADLSAVILPVVDKHSTGGVGDKLTLTVGPMAACCGVAVAKMSGRALGHTGGTIDKLEAIPGFNTTVSIADFIANVNKIGICVAGQTAALAPADKVIYALRDATATVDSIPLIAASIMSKKIAAGADNILLDVKAGTGAFMKTATDAAELAKTMVQIGRDCGKNMAAVVTAMNAPLGYCIGNGLEVAEAVEVLQGRGEADLTELSVELTAQMLTLGDKGDLEHKRNMAINSIESGAALAKLIEMVETQGGDAEYIRNPALLAAQPRHDVLSPHTGYVTTLDGETCGIAAHTAACDIRLYAKPGDFVQKGSKLATLYGGNPDTMPVAVAKLLSAYEFADAPQPKMPLIHEIDFGD